MYDDSHGVAETQKSVAYIVLKESNIFMALLEAAVEAVELDAFAKEIPDLVFHGTTAYSLFKAEATSIPVSNQSNAGGTVRASFRVPFRVQSGAAISQGTGNADAMGRGTGSQWASFALAPVYLFNVCEISWLAQASTDSKQKGLFAVKSKALAAVAGK